MRRKGHDKYQRLLTATVEVLGKHSVAELKAADIARAAGTSAPNFYLYFESVLDAVLAAVQQVSMASPHITNLLAVHWPDEDLAARSSRFVAAYFAHWRRNATLLRARSALVAQGDERFQEAERVASADILLLLGAQFMATQPQQLLPMSGKTAARAGAVLAMLDRLAAYHPGSGQVVRITASDLAESASEMLTVGIRHARMGA